MTYMRRALSLARRALGSASPNPAVGAVVVNGGKVVGEGWTRPPGQDHAEIVALRQAGERASGAVLYTTLEPCNHHGRTPPCTDAILEAGVVEVHAATADPNTSVLGKGRDALNAAGVRTVLGECEDEARTVVEAYLKFVATGLPFVTAKFAVSLDGKLATRTGESKWVSGEESRLYAHRLRAESDAIMGGIGTVLADDPQFTARDVPSDLSFRQPVRVVVDSRGRLPLEAKVLSGPGRPVVALATSDPGVQARLSDAGADIEVAPSPDGRVDLEDLFRRLGRREVTSVLVEGGGTLLGSLFDQGLVDKVVACIAPTIIGGEQAPSPVRGVGVEHVADAKSLDRVEVLQLGRDVVVTGYC